jgi:hypothetical protein
MLKRMLKDYLVSFRDDMVRGEEERGTYVEETSSRDAKLERSTLE